MNQEDIAKSLGYKTKTTINKIELGINDMTYDAIVRLINEYCVDINDLFEINKPVKSKANLLYFIVKDHAFIDGNKRIVASIFLYFMNFYCLFYKDGKACISNNPLAALTLLIAEPKEEEKRSRY